MLNFEWVINKNRSWDRISRNYQLSINLTMDVSVGLSFEQEFSLRVYQEYVNRLDLPTTQDLLLEVLRQSMVKENLLKEIIKNGI